MVFDLFGPVTNLRFSETGQVVDERGDYFTNDFVGLTKAQIQTQIGEPNRRVVREFQIIYHYSQAANTVSGTFKMRTVHFDAACRVGKVVSETSYD